MPWVDYLANDKGEKEGCMKGLLYLDERTKRPDICAHAVGD